MQEQGAQHVARHRDGVSARECTSRKLRRVSRQRGEYVTLYAVHAEHRD